MGRKRKPKGYPIVVADGVCCVGEDRVYNKDRVYNPESDEGVEKSLMDELPLVHLRFLSVMLTCNPVATATHRRYGTWATATRR